MQRSSRAGSSVGLSWMAVMTANRVAPGMQPAPWVMCGGLASVTRTP